MNNDELTKHLRGLQAEIGQETERLLGLLVTPEAARTLYMDQEAAYTILYSSRL